MIFAALSNSAIKKQHFICTLTFFKTYWHNINYMQKVGSEPLEKVSRYENICIHLKLPVIRFLLTLKDSCDCNDKVLKFYMINDWS